MEKAVSYIKEKTNNFEPEIGVILGSGLGDFVNKLDTEHNALSNEMDAVQKVIEKNVESGFKTFG